MKTTFITLTSRGKSMPAAERRYWRLGYIEALDVWGLVRHGEMTHMCYRLGDAPPAKVSAERKDSPMFLFDAGVEFATTRRELAAAFTRLGLLGLVVVDD